MHLKFDRVVALYIMYKYMSRLLHNYFPCLSYEGFTNLSLTVSILHLNHHLLCLFTRTWILLIMQQLGELGVAVMIAFALAKCRDATGGRILLFWVRTGPFLWYAPWFCCSLLIQPWKLTLLFQALLVSGCLNKAGINRDGPIRFWQSCQLSCLASLVYFFN